MRFDRLKDAGAAVRALLAVDLIPNAVELLDADRGGGARPGRRAAALVVGFDGLREQVDWQVAELATLLVPARAAATSRRCRADHVAAAGHRRPRRVRRRRRR